MLPVAFGKKPVNHPSTLVYPHGPPCFNQPDEHELENRFDFSFVALAGRFYGAKL